MDAANNKTKRRKALRKRIRKLLQVPFVAKQLAWRLTAGWFWTYAIATIFGLRGHLQMSEDAFFWRLNGALVNFGFTPTNLKTFTICVKLLWLFAICSFSWIQLIGFLIYVPFVPLLLIVRLYLGKKLPPYRTTRDESFKASRKFGVPISKRTWGFPLFSLLVLWLVLYGQTSASYPLLLALALTALLFCSRVGRALTFAVPTDKDTWDRIEILRANARRIFLKTSELAKTGEFLERQNLNLIIWTGSFLLWNFRCLSSWLHGRAARRRVALVVLLRFMLNLAALGAISILFWAIAVKFAMAPEHVSLLEAVLASASRAIPGIPDSSSLKVPVMIQTLDSVTAWMIFVLYAGPVASLFPAFQEQAIARSAANYARLRKERKAMYRFLEPQLTLRKFVRENPALAKIAKAAIQLKGLTEAEVRQACLRQPDFVRTMASRPELVDFMRRLGAPIPDIDELTRELPPAPTDGGKLPRE